MDKYQKLGLISGQVLMGLIFGVGGVIATALLMTLYDELAGNPYADLSSGILYSMFGGYIGMQIGIGYDGYKYLKEKRRLRDFIRFLCQSIGGLFFGLLIFYYLILSSGPKIDSFFINSFAFVLPMIGSIIGFDLGLVKRLSETDKKDG